MSNNQEIELKTDCEAIQIPAGLKTTIPAGTKVIITQSLGGSYTIACDYGLFRISEDNAAALGLEVELQRDQLVALADGWGRLVALGLGPLSGDSVQRELFTGPDHGAVHGFRHLLDIRHPWLAAGEAGGEG